MEPDIRVTLTTFNDIVEARQQLRALASRLGFSKSDLTLIATALSEVTRNVIEHATGGEVLISALHLPRKGVRIVTRDTGPGIDNVAIVLRDGYSTSRGMGMGLPGARRLMDEFEITSEVNRGTVVTMTKWLS